MMGYGSGLLGVGLATLAAFLAEHLIAGPNLALVFVLPVLVTAINFGLGPALLAAAASVVVFDLLFITPHYSLTVASPSDLWAMALLGVVAVLASGLAARSRLRALDAERETRRAEALGSLAHKVVGGAPPAVVAAAATETLGLIFEAPAIVLVDRDGELDVWSASSGAKLSNADQEAARWALENSLPTRAQTFPFDIARFDFWPLRSVSGQGVIMGVEGRERDKQRVDAERYVELAGAYLLFSLAQGRSVHEV
jgi:K+-sensing histidine kinase KdpD